MSRLGLYLHVPYCVRRCAYCDFPTTVGGEAPPERYVELLLREMEARGAVVPEAERRADTIYLGGGTPSLVPAELVAAALDGARRVFRVEGDAEVTLEANPESVTPGKAAAWRCAGVNRVSLGVQSFDDGELRVLGRSHTADAARRAWGTLREAGFANRGLDLIAGAPGQDRRSFAATLEQALLLAPEHLSIYLLETDKRTRISIALERGELALPPDEETAATYEETLDRLEGAGYRRYEISNWARPGSESRHNRKYWLAEEVLGFGLGAHTLRRGERRANPPEMDGYLRAVEERGDPSEPAGPQGTEERREEAAVLGLRLAEGLDRADFARRWGRDPWEIWGGALGEAVEAALLEVTAAHLRLTRRGLLLANEVFAAMIGTAHEGAAAEG